MLGHIKRNAIPKNNLKKLKTVQIDDGKVKNKMKKCAIGNGKSWDMSGQLKAIYRTEATGKLKTRGREKLGHAWATKSDT